MQIQYLCHIFLLSQLNAFLNPLFQAGSAKRSGHWSPFHRPWNFDTLFVFQLVYLCICALNCIVFARLVSQQSGYRSPFAPRPLVTFAAQTLEQLALALRRLHCIVFCSSGSWALRLVLYFVFLCSEALLGRSERPNDVHFLQRLPTGPPHRRPPKILRIPQTSTHSKHKHKYKYK